MTRQLLTGPDLAERLGFAPGTIRSWARRGMPIAERGRRGSKNHPNRYREADVRAWLNECDAGKLEAVQARARRERAQALLAEQTVAIRAKELVHRDEAERAWPRECEAIRANLRAWVKPLALRIHTAAKAKHGLQSVEAELVSAVHQKLEELAEGPT